MPSSRFTSCRRAAVSILFATAIIPILGLCGLAVDYAMWCEIDASLYNAVNVAALNAVKIAAAGDLNNDANYKTEAKVAGAEWFLASAISTHPSVNGGSLSISISGTTTLTASVTYSGGTIYSTFGKLFGVTTYPFTETASASINTAPYLEVVMMLDNSSSMDIGATNADISELSSLSPCDSSNAYYGSSTNIATWSAPSLEDYGNYTCTWQGVTYDGNTACPVVLPSYTLAGYTLTGYATNSSNQQVFTPNPAINGPPVTSGNGVQFCQNLGRQSGNNMYPVAGAPCAFACHWTKSLSADGKTTADLYGLARRKGITLRLDEVKSAANYALAQMATDNVASFNNLSVGVYAFNSTVQQVYPDPTVCTQGPPACEAGSSFAAAETAVGTGDSGIVPEIALRTGDNDDTAFPEDMNKLASTYVTPAGDGNSAAAPLKVLILITDGFQDDPNAVQGSANERRAFDPTYCQQFKNMGYQVYVVYTPYYPVMHNYYLSNMVSIVEGNGSSSLVTNLTACSSQSQNPTGTYYISAQNQTQLNAALSSFLKQALNAPARFTQ